MWDKAVTMDGDDNSRQSGKKRSWRTRTEMRVEQLFAG